MNEPSGQNCKCGKFLVYGISSGVGGSSEWHTMERCSEASPTHPEVDAAFNAGVRAAVDVVRRMQPGQWPLATFEHLLRPEVKP